jgi:branched-chain amino acid transport system ATP-binding protein
VTQNLAIETRQVSKAFGGLAALDRVNIQIAKGTVTAIVGPNGAGKTTLLNCIHGYVNPDTGEVLLNGESLRGLRPFEIARRGVARTFQKLSVTLDRTVKDNLLVGGHIHASRSLLKQMLGVSESIEEVDELLSALDLRRYEDIKLSDLDYGAQRLVELARSVVSRPTVLLLDEPTAGMTTPEKSIVLAAMQRIRETGVTQVLIEHDLQFVRLIADYIWVLNFGKVLAHGPPGVVLSNQDVIEAYIGRGKVSNEARPMQ